MPPTEFKLSKHNGVTRRLVFPERPSWNALSVRISELYNIPPDLVAVSYVDSDGDQVTLNTEEELSHFLTSSQGVIKLYVQDLSFLRSQASSAILSDAPFLQTPVGPELPLEEEEWHIPHWEGMFPPPPHAFVRTLGDENSDIEDSDTEMPYKPLSASETTETLVPIIVDKGKAKATTVEDLDESVASSVISGDAPPKPPIHVYDVSGIQSDVADMLRAPTPALAESTPKTPLNEVDKQGEDKQMSDVQDSADDPPLPSIESLPSLSNDFANFVTSLGTALSSHPQVSEGLHTILRNAANGTYWRTHREALSKAAEEITQASETAMRAAEVDAGRTVWEAVDTFIRSLSQASGIPTASTMPTQSEGATEPAPAPSPHPAPMPSAAPTTQTEDNNKTNQDQTTSTTSVVPEVECEPLQAEPPKEEQRTFSVHSTERQSSSRPFPHPFASFAPPPFVPPHPPHNIYPGFPFSSARPPPSTAVPPVFPPPPPPFPPLHLPHHMTPPRPPPPPPMNASYQRSFSNLNRSFSLTSPPNTRAPQVAEMKAKVQAAKSMYRAEKARYLQEREQARHQRVKGRRHGGAIQSEMDDSKPFEDLQSLLDASMVSVEQDIVGNASGSRLGHQFTSRHLGSVIEDFRSRAVKRVCKQLADMGFTEYQHPGLADKAASRLPVKGTITKDIEDDIVTNLLEELLPLSSPGPVASGSRG